MTRWAPDLCSQGLLLAFVHVASTGVGTVSLASVWWERGDYFQEDPSDLHFSLLGEGSSP